MPIWCCWTTAGATADNAAAGAVAVAAAAAAAATAGAGATAEDEETMLAGYAIRPEKESL